MAIQTILKTFEEFDITKRIILKSFCNLTASCKEKSENFDTENAKWRMTNTSTCVSVLNQLRTGLFIELQFIKE